MQLFTIGLYQLKWTARWSCPAAIPCPPNTDVRLAGRAGVDGTPSPIRQHDAGPDAAAMAINARSMKPARQLPRISIPAHERRDRTRRGTRRSVQPSNVPPFVSKQLIQHLVTSNPSPAYVGRVAAVFANNGSGVRGDMNP